VPTNERQAPENCARLSLLAQFIGRRRTAGITQLSFVFNGFQIFSLSGIVVAWKKWTKCF
jgi:hypothetical protein